MKTGEELALIGMKKELVVLSKKAEKLKSEYNEYMGVASELISVYEELNEIIKSRECGTEVIKKLKALQAREKRCKAIHKKDFMKLLDSEIEAKINRDSLAQEIGNIEFRMSLRRR